MSPLVRGRKVTENWQEALGARAAQGGVDRMNWRGGGGVGGGGRGGGVWGGGGIWRVGERVWGRVMVCWVGVGRGRLWKISVVGFRGRRGWGLPKPVRGAVIGVVEVGIVRVPVRGPVVV